MSHQADGEAWQDFDREFLKFAKDARNLRIGLAIDGFNPFLKKNTKYSIWHVFVVHGRVKVNDGFAYSRSSITQEGF
jgi:hypothetical protein